jgi:ADP-ribose pyrophosphatase YjhB (NUDIX family)
MLRLHHRLLQRGLLAWARVARGMTLGVRALLVKDGQVLLVKHTYVPGWHLPGGGVEPGESFGEALRREVGEEAGAVLTGEPQLFALYRNRGRDHVALYVCREWERPRAPALPSFEIAASELYPLDRLPDDTTAATLARLREVIAGEPSSPDW